MVFSSIPFLFYFLPAALLLYFAVPKKLKNFVLFLVSLIFYAWGEPKFVLVMLFTIAQGYVFGILIEKHPGRVSRVFMAVSAVISLGLLCVCKYTDFFISNINAAAGLAIPLSGIALPIGISFYTFQILSYTVDVYRRDVPAQSNFLDLGAYIAMFPQLIAGPIVRYSDIASQLRQRTHSFEKAALGVRRFVLGLAKKVLIANTLGQLCSTFQASSDKSVAFFWLYAVAYTLHIYFDFSGYSDMAIGLGKVFGFDFMENFDHPYISGSITEFWRRWHISLGSWFRDYVYIPLGGNRCGKLKWLRNIFIVWFLTGMWHGAAWNFIIWGLFFAVLLTVEKLWLGNMLKKSRVISHIYVMLAVTVSFVIFGADDMSQAAEYIGAMFGAGGHPLVSAEAVYYLRSYAVTIIIGIIGSTSLPVKVTERLRKSSAGEKLLNCIEPFLLLVLLFIITGSIVNGSFNPFLYFRF